MVIELSNNNNNNKAATKFQTSFAHEQQQLQHEKKDV